MTSTGRSPIVWILHTEYSRLPLIPYGLIGFRAHGVARIFIIWDFVDICRIKSNHRCLGLPKYNLCFNFVHSHVIVITELLYPIQLNLQALSSEKTIRSTACNKWATISLLIHIPLAVNMNIVRSDIYFLNNNPLATLTPNWSKIIEITRPLSLCEMKFLQLNFSAYRWQGSVNHISWSYRREYDELCYGIFLWTQQNINKFWECVG